MYNLMFLRLALAVPLLHVSVQHLDPSLLAQVALEPPARELLETGLALHPLETLRVLVHFATRFPYTHAREPAVLHLLGRHTDLDHMGPIVRVLADHGEEELAPAVGFKTLHAGLGVEESVVGQFGVHEFLELACLAHGDVADAVPETALALIGTGLGSVALLLDGLRDGRVPGLQILSRREREQEETDCTDRH